MAQLTADVSRKYTAGSKDTRAELPVAAATTIFMGSAVGLSSGYARQLVAADTFCGFADAKAANVVDANRPGLIGFPSIALGSAGGLTVETRAEGEIVIPLASLVGNAGVTDVGSSVYMSDGNTFTLTSTSNSLIGTVKEYLNGQYTISFKTPLIK